MAGCDMEYDDLAAYFLTPPATPVPPPLVPATAARQLRDALEPIATIGDECIDRALARLPAGGVLNDPRVSD